MHELQRCQWCGSWGVLSNRDFRLSVLPDKAGPRATEGMRCPAGRGSTLTAAHHVMCAAGCSVQAAGPFPHWTALWISNPWPHPLKPPLPPWPQAFSPLPSLFQEPQAVVLDPAQLLSRAMTNAGNVHYLSTISELWPHHVSSQQHDTQ